MYLGVYHMFYFLCFMFLLHSVYAEWPPLNCRRPVKIQDSSVIMSNSAVNKIKTYCDIHEQYDNAIYIKFSRVYNLKHTVVSDSTLSFDFLFEKETKFTLEIHNDRLKVVYPEHQKIRITNNACMAVLARPELEWFNWLRVRINHLEEIRKTFISVDLVSYEGNTFTPCVRFESELLKTDFQIALRAYTDSGMRQEVQMITQKKPDLNKYSTQELANRLTHLENRMSRIHKSLQRYMTNHDEHVTQTKDSHETLKKQLYGTRNGLKSRAESHMIFWFVSFTIVGVLICGWTNYRIEKEKRFHLL